MEDFLGLSKKEKLEIFEQLRTKSGMVVQAIEKDWWVTQTLRIVFSMECGPHLVFKGGTSLSKAWGLIERFSEDIDLALDRRYLGFNKPMTGSQVAKLRRKSHEYISTVFYNELKNKFEEAGFKGLKIQLAEVADIDQDPIIIEIYYPTVSTPSPYLQPRVLLEIGSRSLMEPSTERTIISLVGENYIEKKFADTTFSIPVVNPERTFLEKIFLLHEEFQKETHKIRVDRLSRHLYDIEKLMNTVYMEKVFTNPELYINIVEHRRTLTAIRGIDYSNHTPSKIRIVPPDAILAEWKSDYEVMQTNMIYGDSLSFKDLILRVTEIQSRINSLEISLLT